MYSIPQINNSATEAQKYNQALISKGQKVFVKCPVFRNGEKLEATVKEIIKDKYQVKVVINGNTKSTIISISWIFPIN